MSDKAYRLVTFCINFVLNRTVGLELMSYILLSVKETATQCNWPVSFWWWLSDRVLVCVQTSDTSVYEVFWQLYSRPHGDTWSVEQLLCTVCQCRRGLWPPFTAVSASHSVTQLGSCDRGQLLHTACQHCWGCLMRAPGSNVPLMRFLILALCILFACLYHMLPDLSFL